MRLVGPSVVSGLKERPNVISCKKISRMCQIDALGSQNDVVRNDWKKFCGSCWKELGGSSSCEWAQLWWAMWSVV